MNPTSKSRRLALTVVAIAAATMTSIVLAAPTYHRSTSVQTAPPVR